jgi:hypothetical protein
VEALVGRSENEMKVSLAEEELWPYFAEEDGYIDVELPEELWKEYATVRDAFFKLNWKVRDYFDNAKTPPPPRPEEGRTNILDDNRSFTGAVWMIKK